MTSTTSGTEVVLKSDGLGRLRTPAARRQSLLEEFEKSGLSGAKFAALAGVKYSTFASWQLKQRRQQGGRGRPKPVDAAGQMRWLEAVIEQAQSPGGEDRSVLLLELPGGARAQIGTVSQAVMAAALLQALEKPATAC